MKIQFLAILLIALPLIPAVAEPTQNATIQTVDGRKLFQVDLPLSFSGGATGKVYTGLSEHIWLDNKNHLRLAVWARTTDSGLTPDFEKRTLAKARAQHKDAVELKIPGLYGTCCWWEGYAGFLSYRAALWGEHRYADFQLSSHGGGESAAKIRSASIQARLKTILSSIQTL